MEDQLVGSDDDFAFEFEDFVSPVTPIPNIVPTATPTLEPILPGNLSTPVPTGGLVSSGGTSMEESSSGLDLPVPTEQVIYPTAQPSGGSSGIVWIIVLALLIVAGGGAVVFVQHQRKRRRIAMRAAQRRAQAARAQAMQQRPYARTNGQPQPRTGAYPNQQTQVRRPVQGSEAGQYAPYAGPYAPSGYRRADAEVEQPQPQRVGRRTAYRQAQREKENNSLDV